MGSYQLNWPGLTSLQVFIIDTGSKQIYSSSFPLPTEQKHLHHLKNQYVKLSVVLKLLPPTLKDDAVSQLLKLSSNPGVQGLFIKSIGNEKNDQHTACYVPVTTLLAFVILYPWSAELQTLRNSIFEFLGGYQEWPCAECGFVKRDCLCETGRVEGCLDQVEFIGYASDVHDIECQTELVSGSDSANTQDTAPNAETGGLSVSFRVPPGIHLSAGAKIPLSLQGWPHIPGQFLHGGLGAAAFSSPATYPPFNSSSASWWPSQPFSNDPVLDVLSSLTPSHDGMEKGRGKSRAQHKDVHTQTPQNLYDSKKRMLKRDSARLKAPSAALIEELEGERLAKEKGSEVSGSTSPSKVVESRSKKKTSLVGDDDGEDHQSPPAKKSKANKRSAPLTLLDSFADANADAAAFEEESVNIENLPPAFRSFILQPEVGNLPKPRVPRESVWKFVRRTTDPEEAPNQPLDTDVNIPSASETEAETVAKTAENNEEKLTDAAGTIGSTFARNTSSVTDVDMETSDINGTVAESNSAKDEESNKQTSIDYVGCFEYMPTGDIIVRCTFPGCEQCFDSKVAADFHNSLHQNDSETQCYQCPQCAHKVPFGRWFEMLRHLRLAHETLIVAEDVGCWLCGVEFESPEVAKKHEEYHYNSRYKCIHCGVLYLTWKQLQAHLFDCVNRAKKEVNVGCPYCMFVFHIRNMRRIHISCHCDEGLRCPQCSNDDVWDNWRDLRKHYLQKHGRAQNTMNRERRAPPPSYRCQVCSIEVDSTELYYKHMRKTHDWTPYVLLGCTQCEKTFTSKKAADWHERFAHSEEFSCSKCDFKAASKVMIKLHMQKHDERQLTCSECEKTFVHYHQLQIHMAKHARNAVHTCKICYQEFVQYRDLRQHMAKDHPGVKERPAEDEQFGCESCTSRFPSLVALKQHVRREHRDELEDDDDDDENRFSDRSASISKPETSPPTAVPPKRGRGSRGGKLRGMRGRGRGGLRGGRRGYRRPTTWRKTYDSIRNFGQEDEEDEEEEPEVDAEEGGFNDDENDADFAPMRGRGGKGRRAMRKPTMPIRRGYLPSLVNSPYMTGENLENPEDDDDEMARGVEGKPDEHLPLHLVDHNYYNTKSDTPSAMRQKAFGRPSHLDNFITASHVHVPDVSEFEEYGNASLNGVEDVDSGVFVPPSCRTSGPRMGQFGVMKRGSAMLPATRMMNFGGGRGVLTRGGRGGRSRGPRMSGFLTRGGGSMVGYPASSPRRERTNSHNNNFQWSGMADILTAANHADEELTENDLATVAAELQNDQSMRMLQDLVMSSIGDHDSSSHRDDTDDLSLSPVKQLLQSVAAQAPLLNISPDGRSRIIPPGQSPRTTVGLNGKGNVAGIAQTEVDDIELKDDDYMLWHAEHEASATDSQNEIQGQEQGNGGVRNSEETGGDVAEVASQQA